MADEPENLVLVYLRRLDEKVDQLREDARETRLTLNAILQLLATHDNHMVRIEIRLDRIEKRLDLVDAAP